MTIEAFNFTKEELRSANGDFRSADHELYPVYTEFERTNNELKRLNREQAHLLNSIGSGIVFLDQQLCIRKLNPAISSMFDLTPRDIGRPLDHIACQLADPAVMLNAIRSIPGNGTPPENEVTTQAGEWLSMQTVPVRSETGQLEGVIVAFTDISNVKDAERANSLNEELQIALKELESFSYSVSHDLRSPSRRINGYLAILSEDFGDILPPEAQTLVDRSRLASERMGELIDDLLELSIVSRCCLKKKTVNLSKLATEACDRLREAEPQRAVEIAISDGISARGDKSLLIQMFENLLGNAWKYTSTNPSARIEFGREVIADQEVFYVRDNGVGFDMTYGDKLFGAFQRLHGAEYEGAGIGLATVKRIVDRHLGRVWAVSKAGEGATFYFTLP